MSSMTCVHFWDKSRKVTLWFSPADDNISGGKLIIDVKYLFLHVHHETRDICKETSCPISGDFVLSHSQALPGFAPPVSPFFPVLLWSCYDIIFCCFILHNFPLLEGAFACIVESNRGLVLFRARILLRWKWWMETIRNCHA